MPRFDNILKIAQQTFYLSLVIVVGLTFILILDSTTNDSYIFIDDTTKDLSPQTTTVFLAGDIMLSRNVGTKMLGSKNYSLPFEQVRNIISQADISFGNLESPFFNQGEKITQGLIFKAEPQGIFGLAGAGFDVLSTANNHGLDQGKEGLEYTLSLLSAHGITAVGTGQNCHDGKIIPHKKIKFGFLAYSYAAYNDGGSVSDPFVCDWKDTDQIKQDIEILKQKVDFLIVSAHMGEEYARNPEEINISRVHNALDAGADMFVGHHPHWIQTIEEYDNKWIFYSLGNFVFDQMWSEETREGLTVMITITMTDQKPKIQKIELKPVIIDNFCCPRWATEEETIKILAKIGLTNPILFSK
jgi:gamma-polyglutamate biosynthesis protein CapA